MPTVLVTGGGRGIGRAVALAFAEPGSTVAVASRTRSELQETGAAIEKRGAQALILTVDVTDEGSVAAAFKIVSDAGGGIDVLVNNAGIGGGKPLLIRRAGAGSSTRTSGAHFSSRARPYLSFTTAAASSTSPRSSAGSAFPATRRTAHPNML